MSNMAKAARAAMKAKAARMGGKGDPKTKVDSSSWTPPEMMNTEAKTGMRPLTRRAYKKGGKVIGKCEGGAMKIRADRKARKTGGRSLVTDLINRNDKKANLAREGGDAHTGGLKRGGRAHKLYGGTFVEKGKAGTPLPYAMKHGGRRKRADGGPLTDVSGSSEVYMPDQSTGNAARDLARISRSRARAEDNPSYNPGNAGPAYTPGNYSEMDFNAARDAAKAKFEAGNGPSTFAYKGREYGFDATGPAAAPRAAAPAPRQQGPMGTLERSQFMDANATPQMGTDVSDYDAAQPTMAPPRAAPAPSTVRDRYQAAMATPSRDLATMLFGTYDPNAAPAPAPASRPAGLLGMGGLPRTRAPAVDADTGMTGPQYADAVNRLHQMNRQYGTGSMTAADIREMARAQMAGYKRGGKVHDDIAMDKKLVKKAFRQHDKNMHGGKHEELKLKKGGRTHKQGGGSMTPDPRKAIPGDAPTRGYRPGSTATGNPPPKYGSVGELIEKEGLNRKSGGKATGTYFGGTRPTGGRMPKADGGKIPHMGARKLYAQAIFKHGKTVKTSDAAAEKGYADVAKKYGDEMADNLRAYHASNERDERARGGRTKGKTNIIIAINPQQGGQQGPMPQMGPTPRPTAPMPVAPPGMPGGAPMPGMGAMPPGGGMPPGMPGMPPGMPPMPRKSGGRAYRSYKDMDAGALSGMGRLEKTEIEHGKRVGRLSGGRARSYKDMDAGSLSGMGRIEKTAIQKHKR